MAKKTPLFIIQIFILLAKDKLSAFKTDATFLSHAIIASHSFSLTLTLTLLFGAQQTARCIREYYGLTSEENERFVM